MPDRSAALSLTAAVLVLAAAAVPAVAAPPRPGPIGVPQSSQELQAAIRALPLISEYRYSLAAEAWTILWFRKSGLGGARLRHRAGPGGTLAWELVGGSDPSRAPLRFNYWLYVSERATPAGTALLSVTRDSDDRSIADAQARGGREVPGTRATCRLIRSTLDRSTATTIVERFVVSRDLTFKEMDDLPAFIEPVPSSAKPPRSLPLPEGTVGGLPSALAGLLADTLAWFRAGQPAGSRPHGRPRPYVHEGKLYDITLEKAEARPRSEVPAVGTVDLIKGRFVVRSRPGGNRNTIDLEFGTSGRLAAIPVRIVIKPRWWLKLELALE